MINEIIFYGSVVLVVIITLAFFKKGTAKPISPDQSGQFKLKMNKLYGVVGFLCLLLGLVFLMVLPIITEPNARTELYSSLIIILLTFWGTGILSLLYYRNHRVRFDEHTIVASDIFGRERTVKWVDLVDISFRISTGFLVLKTKNEKVKVHQHLVGLSQFIVFVERYTT